MGQFEVAPVSGTPQLHPLTLSLSGYQEGEPLSGPEARGWPLPYSMLPTKWDKLTARP